jgi:hypothetical protein
MTVGARGADATHGALRLALGMGIGLGLGLRLGNGLVALPMHRPAPPHDNPEQHCPEAEVQVCPELLHSQVPDERLQYIGPQQSKSRAQEFPAYLHWQRAPVPQYIAPQQSESCWQKRPDSSHALAWRAAARRQRQAKYTNTRRIAAASDVCEFIARARVEGSSVSSLEAVCQRFHP